MTTRSRKAADPLIADGLTPHVAIPPGEHLADTLRELGMSQSELARKIGRPVQAINQIVNGSKGITAETALQLEDATGVPAHVWVRLEGDYRLNRARLARAAAQKKTGAKAARARL
jgi:HTH-type transcriptional regulator/antitoxin HigA